MKSDIGVIGLAVMGENLVMNMESKSTVWLLGSNSERGFHSMYGGFCREGGDFLRGRPLLPKSDMLLEG